MKKKEQTIREFTGFTTIKDVTCSLLPIVAELVEKNFKTAQEQKEWCEKCWEDFGDDIIEYLRGLLDPNCIDVENVEDDDLVDFCSMQDLAEAIKANSESFFGWDITSYLEK